MAADRWQGREADVSSAVWGQEVVTIADNVGQGATKTCRRCLVWSPSGNTGNIHLQKGATADANDVALVDDVVYDLRITNTNQMYFYGGTNGDKVYIIWFG